MHPQRLTVASAAAVGASCTFLPWVVVPLLGSVDGTELDGRGWITFALCVAAFLSAVSTDNAIPFSPGARRVSLLFGFGVVGIGLWTIAEINEDPLGIMSVGTGLYLLIAAGAAIVVLPGLIKRAPKQPQTGPGLASRPTGTGPGASP